MLKKAALLVVSTLIFAAAVFYTMLPAINLRSAEIYFFIFLSVMFFCVMTLFIFGRADGRERQGNMDRVKKVCRVPLYLSAALFALLVIGSITSGVIFNPRAYSRLLELDTGDFASEVEEASYTNIPMLDKASAQRLGDRKLGELSDMVSQFEVGSDYSQINYKGRPVRVSPLLYGDFFKWLNNNGEGLPAYIIIDMVNQNVEVVRLPEGMKYSTSDLFFRNIKRYIRFMYPTYMFDSINFEIDENGTPYWICPRVVKTIGLFGGRDIKGAVMVNAITGESEYYEDVPSWVDRVYSAELIIQQYDYYGRYTSGILNSVFGQKGVTVTTDGYNYIALEDDVYMYTGITSVGGDESNIGFILSNQRTKQTTYYPCAGAEEYSAMSSARGVVQHLKYSATFPLLLNVSGQPTYFISLKDDAGLVKMFAMVNVQQYNIVATGVTVADCEKEYNRLLLQNGIITEIKTDETSVSGRVEEIRTAVIAGNTWWYFRIEGDQRFFSVSAAENEEAVALSVGDRVTVVFSTEAKGSLVPAERIEPAD